MVEQKIDMTASCCYYDMVEQKIHMMACKEDYKITHLSEALRFKRDLSPYLHRIFKYYLLLWLYFYLAVQLVLWSKKHIFRLLFYQNIEIKDL